MRRSLTAVVLCLLLVAAGCVSLDILGPSFQGPATMAVPSNPFGNPGPVTPATTTNYPPASTEVAVRVGAIGQKVLEANKDIGLKPLFATHTCAQAEIFHRGTAMIHVTDALVKQCQNDAEVAALLAQELGKMVAEREALSSPRARNPQAAPPQDVPIGNAAQPGAFDAGRMAELAHYDKQRREAAKVLPPPDPDQLALRYLEKAGYPTDSLNAVKPLLDMAENNYVLEKQFKNYEQPQWRPQTPPPQQTSKPAQ